MSEFNTQLGGGAQESAAFVAEASALLGAYEAHGFRRPPELIPPALIMGVCRSFVPDQMPRAQDLRTLSPASRRYFARVVQPELALGAQRQNPQTLALAHQAGRVLGAAESSGDVIVFHPPMKLGSETIEVDDQHVPYAIESGQVVEYGMGINGLFVHLNNVRTGKYRVCGIHKSSAEAAVLQGILDYNSVTQDEMTVVYQGITRRVGDMLKTNKEQVDLVIASRAHPAGRELRYGIDKSSSLLRVGGLLVARGPRDYDGIDYDQVHSSVQASRHLETIVDHTFDIRHTLHAAPEPNRLIVAKKLAA